MINVTTHKMINDASATIQRSNCSTYLSIIIIIAKTLTVNTAASAKNRSQSIKLGFEIISLLG
jgi:hypothetical protein